MKNIVKNPIKIDRSTGKIIVNKDFLRKADYFNTAEYYQLEEVRKAYPLYTVEARTIKTKDDKENYRGLTYKYMEAYIKRFKPELQEEFETMCIRAGCHSIRYAHLKGWFLKACPEVNSFEIERSKEEIDEELVA